jgi:CheY-like chemotaxis protein
VFILEDDPTRSEAFAFALQGADVYHLAKDVDEALAKFEPPYDLVLLDHDLGGEAFVSSGEANTGAGFVRAMNEDEQKKALQGARVVVHSWNPDGALTMLKLLKDRGVMAFRIPYGKELLNFCRTLCEEV